VDVDVPGLAVGVGDAVAVPLPGVAVAALPVAAGVAVALGSGLAVAAGSPVPVAAGPTVVVAAGPGDGVAVAFAFELAVATGVAFGSVAVGVAAVVGTPVPPSLGVAPGAPVSAGVSTAVVAGVGVPAPAVAPVTAGVHVVTGPGDGGNSQLAGQASPPTVLPSSHCSPLSRMPFPHTAGALHCPVARSHVPPGTKMFAAGGTHSPSNGAS
jgi:hypothetical protein